MSNMESILYSIKKLLGLQPQYEAFDSDLIININTAIMFLKQMGVGLEDFHGITGPNETWADFIGTETDLEGIKTYVYIKVKMIFDPPTSSILQQALNDMLRETEYRIYQKVQYNT